MLLNGLLLLSLLLQAENRGIPKPKLVVVIAIDQFRSDYLERFKDRFLPASLKGKIGGFQYLRENGTLFPQAEFDILQCMTAPGHATILTGSFPYLNGIPINIWQNALGKKVYCVEDSNSPIVGSTSPGVSPKNLIASTVGDELKNEGYSSKVVSIALKDRAAVLMGGHRANLALWFDPKALSWVTSNHYLSKLPNWVESFNTKIDKKKKLDSPYGIEITEQLAEKAIESFDLGNGKHTDLLLLSFSSHDYVGHKHGPNSKEIEEMVFSEDEQLAKLFQFIFKRLPKDRVLFVLTADHGISPVPTFLQQNKIDAGYIDEEKLQDEIEQHLKQTLGNHSEPWISGIQEFNVYLSQSVEQREKAEERVKSFLQEKPWVLRAFTKTDYSKGLLPPGMLRRQIEQTYFPGRSGDIVIIPKPHQMPSGHTVTHITSYRYDCTVPILFAGPGFRKNFTLATSAKVVDIAPTLSFILGTVPPNLSEGRVLVEAFSALGAPAQ